MQCAFLARLISASLRRTLTFGLCRGRIQLFSEEYVKLGIQRIFVCFIVIWAMLASSSWSDEIKVIYTGSDVQSTVEGKEKDGVIYASLMSLAQAFRATLFWAPLSQKVVFKLGNGRITVTAFSATVVVNEEAFNLPLPATILGGDLYVPIDSFASLLGKVVAGQLLWEASNRRLIVKSSDNNILGLSIEERANGTLILIRTTTRFAHIEDTTSEPNWLNISIYHGKLDPVALQSTEAIGAVKQTAAYQYENSAQLSFRIDKSISKYRISQKEHPHQILVLLKKFGTSSDQNVPDIKIDKKLWTIHTIVIDPGHGGKDDGAVGPTGLKEKEVVLDIALRLARLLQDQLRVKVILTREKDKFVGLQERGRIANRNDGKLFVSLHCNAHPKSTCSGTEVFFLSEAKTEDAMRVAQLENSVLKLEFSSEVDRTVSEEDFTMRDMLNMITMGMVSNNFLKESQDLAAFIQKQLAKRLNRRDRGVKQAGFYVMMGTLPTMPSVLVEIAFITNPYEEKLLKQRTFRKKAAQAIFYGIKAFIDKYQREIAG